MRSAFRIWFFVVWSVGPGPLEAAPVVLTRQQQCTTQNGRTTCRQVFSSGTVIGRHTDGRLVVLTCGHGILPGVPFMIQVEPRGAFEAAEIHRDRENDIGLALLKHSAAAAYLPVARVEPAVGANVTSGGWYQSKYQAAREMAVTRASGGGGLLGVNGTFGQGESGGPAVYQGELVGVIVGNTAPAGPGGAKPARGEGNLTSLATIRQFIAAQLGTIPGEPGPGRIAPADAPADAPPDPAPRLKQPAKLFAEAEPRPRPAPPDPDESLLPLAAAVNTADMQQIKTDLITEIHQVTADVIAEIARVRALDAVELAPLAPAPALAAAPIAAAAWRSPPGGPDATRDAMIMLGAGAALGFFIPRTIAKIRQVRLAKRKPLGQVRPNTAI